MKSLFLTGWLLIASGFITSTLAVKAYPYPIDVQQPNGETIFIHLHGDEYFNYMTADNGGVIVSDHEGYFRYADISEDGVLIPGEIIVSNSALRSDLPGLITPSSPVFKEKIQQPAMGRTIEKKLRQAVDKKQFFKSSLRSSNAIQEVPYKMKALVILVNFQDVKFSVSNPAFVNLLNQPGYSVNGATGSARDYFFDNSDGAFEPEFDVYGPVTLQREMAYYGENDANGYDKHVDDLIIDACTEAKKAYGAYGLNFNDYAVTYDTLGAVLRNVFVVYAGYNEAEGGGANTIWPQKSSIFYRSTRVDNVLLANYACTSELQGRTGTNMAAIGTFCHEFGHVLGLPDFYDANYETDGFNAGVGTWSIMDTGNYLNNSRTPPSYSVTERFFLSLLWQDEINWIDDLYILPPYVSRSAELSPISSNFDERKARGYIVETPNKVDGFPYEFFVLENRKKTGWDSYVAAEGMLVFHVDWDINNQYTINYGTEQFTGTALDLWLIGLPNLMGDHLCYNLLKANNDPCVIENNRAVYKQYDGHPFPGASNITSLSDYTTPNLRSWDNKASGISMENITKMGDGAISFNLKKVPASTVNLQQNQPGVYVQNLEIYFKNLSGNAWIEIYDISGRKLVAKPLADSQHSEYIGVKGIYMAKLIDDGQTFSYKIAIE